MLTNAYKNFLQTNILKYIHKIKIRLCNGFYHLCSTMLTYNLNCLQVHDIGMWEFTLNNSTLKYYWLCCMHALKRGKISWMLRTRVAEDICLLRATKSSNLRCTHTAPIVSNAYKARCRCVIHHVGLPDVFTYCRPSKFWPTVAAIFFTEYCTTQQPINYKPQWQAGRASVLSINSQIT